MISIVIPAREEPYLQKTIDCLFDRAEGKIEVVVVLDGCWVDPPLNDHENLVIVHRGDVRGMRSSVNAGVAASKYDYILKLDGHCLMAQGFDKQLVEDCKEWNWCLVPTRYSLATQTWDRKINKKYEFQYISSDDLKGKTWHAYGKRVKQGEMLIDLMTTQGSCWFMTRKWWDHIEGEDEVNYGHMGREAQEICLKTWLGGGRFVLTRNTWYAHWSKSRQHLKYGREMNKQKLKSTKFATDFWFNDRWEKAVRPLSWLVDKFAPVPTWDYKKQPAEHLPTVTGDIKKYIENNFELRNGHNKDLMIKGMDSLKMYEMFNAMGFRTGCEIGVFGGINAELMCRTISDLKLYLIEPYKDHPFGANGKFNHEKAKQKAYRRTKGHDVMWLEGFSEDMMLKIPDNSLDFVYIGGGYTHASVMLDILLSLRKVREGGVISGHNYSYDKNKPGEVVMAVNDFANANGYHPIYITERRSSKQSRMDRDRYTSWMIIRK